MRRVCFGACVMASALAGGVISLHAQKSAQTFRSTARMVDVNVSVLDGKRPVVGLKPADFVLRDNGIIQKISLIDVEPVPLDVTVVLDLSGSAEGELDRTRREATEIVAMLRAEDRLRLVAVGRAPREIVALQSVANLNMPEIVVSGSSAIYDTIGTALIAPVVTGRRRLIVVMTDAAENSSILELPELEAIARRSDAVLCFVFNDPTTSRGLKFYHPMPITPLEQDLEGLRRIAELTGGDPGEQLWPGRVDAAKAFKRLFDTFRQSYILRFVPEGVKTGGWHELDVTVPARRGYTVRFRRGYDDR